MRRLVSSLLPGLAALAGACHGPEVRAVLYENFSSLAAPPDGSHYEQFAEIGGYPVRLACFTVQTRQVNCGDAQDSGLPNLRPAVVECDCPCAARAPDPCDASRPEVIAGTVRGVVDHTDGPYRLGGVEFPTPVALESATAIFITVEPSDADDPLPSVQTVLRGELHRSGAVLFGELRSLSVRPVRGYVTVVPVEDEVQL